MGSFIETDGFEEEPKPVCPYHILVFHCMKNLGIHQTSVSTVRTGMEVIHFKGGDGQTRTVTSSYDTRR